MNLLSKKYFTVLISSLVLEIGSTFYITYVSEKNVVGMAFFAFIGPFLNLPFVNLIVETKTLGDRGLVALYSAFGFTLGSLITYYFF
jgi:hypothetical protein